MKVEVQEENSRPTQPPSQARSYSLAACSCAHVSPRNLCSPVALLSAPCSPGPSHMPAGTSRTEEASVLPSGKWLTTAQSTHTVTRDNAVTPRECGSDRRMLPAAIAVIPATTELSLGRGFLGTRTIRIYTVMQLAVTCAPQLPTPSGQGCALRPWASEGPWALLVRVRWWFVLMGLKHLWRVCPPWSLLSPLPSMAPAAGIGSPEITPLNRW